MKELIRILKEEYGFCSNGLNELDEICKNDLDSLININVKKKAPHLIREIKDLVNDIEKVAKTKEEISNILHELEHYKGIKTLDDENKEKILKNVLSSYDSVSISVTKKELDYEGIVKVLNSYKNIDFVGHYRFTLFEPLDLNEWKKFEFDKEKTLVLYAKDLEGKMRSKDALMNVSKLIGSIIKEEDDKYKDYDKRTYKVINDFGLHARPAAKLVQKASEYKDLDILIGKKGEDYVNCKSIMGVMMLLAYKGTNIEILCKGNNDEIKSFYKDIETITDYNKRGNLEKVFKEV